jgi:hypothetical protein
VIGDAVIGRNRDLYTISVRLNGNISDYETDDKERLITRLKEMSSKGSKYNWSVGQNVFVILFSEYPAFMPMSRC